MYAVVSVTAAAVAFFGLGLVRAINPLTYEWLTSGIGQISSFVAGEQTEGGYFSEMLQMFGILPGGADLFFGVGTGILDGTKYAVNSDVGFINDIWRGGILYLLVMTGLLLRTLLRFIRGGTLRREDGIYLAVLFLFVFVITNIKGSFFIHSDVTVIFWLLVPTLVWEKTEGA